MSSRTRATSRRTRPKGLSWKIKIIGAKHADGLRRFFLLHVLTNCPLTSRHKTWPTNRKRSLPKNISYASSTTSLTTTRLKKRALFLSNTKLAIVPNSQTRAAHIPTLKHSLTPSAAQANATHNSPPSFVPSYTTPSKPNNRMCQKKRHLQGCFRVVNTLSAWPLRLSFHCNAMHCFEKKR